MKDEIKHLKDEIVRMKKAHLKETVDLLNKHAQEKEDLARSLKCKHRQEKEQERIKHNEEINELTDRMLRERNYDIHLLNEKVEAMLAEKAYDPTRSSTKPATFQMVLFHILYSNTVVPGI